MKIIGLEAENVMRLKAIRLHPDGDTVVLGGDNDQGKSSVLNCIWYTLAGESVMCEEPLRRGADKGFSKLDLGELIAERKVTKSGTTLVVTNRAGDKKASPQTVLNALLGTLTFDPLAFSRMDPKKQRETLAKLVGIDFGPLTAEYDRVFGDRTIINREVDRLRALVQGKTETPGLPDAEIKTEDVLAKLDAARKHNQTKVEAGNAFSAAEDAEEFAKATVQRCELQIKQIREQLAKAEAELVYANNDLTKARGDSAEAAARLETIRIIPEEPFRRELAEIGESNAKIRSNIEVRQKRKELDTAEAQSGAYTKHLDGILEKKRTLVEQAKFPLPGLAITDDAVLFEGLPLQQASSARQIKISAAIGMALNPKLRVMIIREGSLLDAKSLAALQDLANSNDFQLWIERVGTGKEISVVIEDGEVAENRL